MRIGEHIVTSSLTKNKLLLLCNHSASYDNFSILKLENKKYVIELKENLLTNERGNIF